MKRHVSATTALVSLFSTLITWTAFLAPAHAAKDQDTITTISASPTSVVMGSAVTLTANVEPTKGGSNPTGSVTFSVGGVQIGSPCTLASKTCSISYTWSVPGSYQVIGTYTPTGNFLASVSAPITVTVTRKPSTTSVVSSKINATVGDPLAFTTTVTGTTPTPTGTITLYAYESNTVIGTCTLSAGACVINLVATNVGTHRVWSSYSGNDSDYLPSNSAYIYQVIAPKPTPTVSVSTSPSPSNFGSSISINVTVTGSGETPTGTVNIENGELTIGNCSLTLGSCTFATAALSVGSHVITAEYLGDSKYGVASGTATHVVNAYEAPTTTTITSSSNPADSGTAVTFNIQVRNTDQTPTGNVKILKDSVELGTCTLSAGVCTYSTSSLPVGSFTITAAYQGVVDRWAASSGSLTQVMVIPGSRTTSITLLPAVESATVGTAVTFTATVTGASVVTGTVSFSDDATEFGTCVLSSGACSISRTFSTVKTHTVIATFIGNASFDTSTATSFFVTSKRPSGISVTTPKSTVPRLTPVTFTITLDSSATGSISIEDNEVTLSGCTITTPGTCTSILTFTRLGSHDLDFEYSGDGTHLSSITSYDLTVGLAQPTVVVTSDKAPAKYGEIVTFSTTLSDSSATGTITFFSDGTGIGSCVVSSGACSIANDHLSFASHEITAVYSGDSNFAGSTSAPITQIITRGTTSVSITASDNPFAYGSGLTLFATVTSGLSGATGQVQFEDMTGEHEVILGSCTLSGTTCSLTLTSPLTIGVHKLVAEYMSDGNYLGSKSAELLETINPPAAGVSVISSSATAKLGETITITINVSDGGSTPTGTVQLKDGGANLGGLLTLVAGSATYVTSSLGVGSHNLTATYSGDSSHSGDTSPTLVQTIVHPVTVSFSAIPTELAFADPISLSATVTSAGGTPTGTVVFEEEISGSEVIVGSCTLSSGACSVSISNLTSGSHSLYAEFDGVGNFGDGASAHITVIVTPRPIASTPVAVQKVESISVPTTTLVKGKPLAVTITEATGGVVDFNSVDGAGRITLTQVTIPSGAVKGTGTLVINIGDSAQTESKGFLAIEMKVLSSDKTPILQLAKPLLLKISRQGTTGKPATSADGIIWEAIAKVVGEGIGIGSTNGYYVGPDKSMNVLTLRTSYFDLLKAQNQLYVKTSVSHINVGQSMKVGTRGGAGTGAITYLSVTPEFCSVTADGSVTGLKVGACLIQAKKKGDDNYLPAVSLMKEIDIRP